MILVLSGEADAHADTVEEELRRLDVPVARFDPARYPAEAGLSVRIDAAGQVGGVLRDGDQTIALDAIDAVWLRRPGYPRVPEALSGTPVGTAAQVEAYACLADLWELLDVAFVPATPAAVALAAHKMRQLTLAGRLGFEVPGTLVTNDPDAFLDHYADTSGRMITKRAVPSQRLQTVEGDQTARHTIPVRPRDLADVESVRLGPILTQPMIDKRFEIRVTVVGDEVFSAAIHSQETHHTRVDFRHYDDAHTPITRYRLPDVLRERCVEITRALGLRYSAIDLIVTPDGRTVFLELNPNGQYLWIEYATGLPITRALAALLAGKGAS
ncbi:ATP-dependent carboxylate-amine ligase [Streptosporangiaceae bacterium NEAU-GS5]|nr:ATP-dependent carboxylate-amine ligase [Streptosporangiaceae bacterium NEAU-GS5]